jgi:hypothetical protein
MNYKLMQTLWQARLFYFKVIGCREAINQEKADRILNLMGRGLF